ncbi:MAG: sigma-54-dependent Fis family transcriptional regulator, partial [Gammaproteobacteria bacterium]|nr:sigma-54-dependent Fis family transcriptional regulator [Gammaproteobacteria bacterium]
LRERGNDSVLIAEALLNRLSAQHGLTRPSLTEEVRSALLSYPWPGNVRELKNAVERALLLSPSGELSLEELLGQSAPRATAEGRIPFPASLDEISAAAARSTLEMCQGNRSEAARRLGISRARLSRLMNRVQNRA